MAIHYVDGDLFAVAKRLADDGHKVCIGQGNNIRGVSGGGISGPFREHWPLADRIYRDACGQHLLNGGDAALFHRIKSAFGEQAVAFLMTQVEPGADARPELIAQALDSLHDQNRVETIDTSVVPEVLRDKFRPNVKRVFCHLVIPEIGCGIGGLRREQLHEVLESVVWAQGSDEYDKHITVVRYRP